MQITAGASASKVCISSLMCFCFTGNISLWKVAGCRRKTQTHSSLCGQLHCRCFVRLCSVWWTIRLKEPTLWSEQRQPSRDWEPFFSFRSWIRKEDHPHSAAVGMLLYIDVVISWTSVIISAGNLAIKCAISNKKNPKCRLSARRDSSFKWADAKEPILWKEPEFPSLVPSTLCLYAACCCCCAVAAVPHHLPKSNLMMTWWLRLLRWDSASGERKCNQAENSERKSR